MDNIDIQFSYVTSHEKLEIMLSIPEKNNIDKIKNSIIQKRKFKDKEIKYIF